jgi:hypothetical protein
MTQKMTSPQDGSLGPEALALRPRRWARGPATAAWIYGGLVTVVLAYFVLGLVVQVSDSFGNLLQIQTPTLAQLVTDQFTARAYLRPLLWAQMKIVYQLSGGEYYAWFRGVHVAQVAVLIALSLLVMKPRTWLDAAMVPLALAVLIGSHTFVPLVREAFPINSFLTIATACVGAVWLAVRERPRWYTDLLIVSIFVAGVLTVESGILVWVVCVTAAVLGRRGVSRPALAVMTLALVGYAALRMIVLDVGTPSLVERASGYGFQRLEPSELIARFEGRAWTFYLYNVISSISTVLFSEPKGGVWRFVYELTLNDVHPWTAVSVASSTASTMLIGWFLWSRRARIRARTLDRDDAVVLLFVVVLVANAVISYPYTKNVIMSPAGALLALAVYSAGRVWLQSVSTQRMAAAMALIAVLSCGWAFRMAGNHYNLRRTAAEQRAEWVSVDSWLERQRIVVDDPGARALRDTLRRDAVWTHPTPFQPSARWAQWFDIDW